jgi:inhibitor of cysteine peptidase
VKPIFITLVTSMLAISLFIGCVNGAVNAYSDPEEIIGSSPEKEFVILIALESNPTTGYSWQASCDSTILELVEEAFELGIYAKENIVGAGGTQLFRYKALKSGEAEIIFVYKRSWEPEILDIKVFTVDIK